MTIELTIILSVLSVAAAIYFGLAGKRRNDQQDTRRETSDMTTVVVKLENIGNGVNEIKSDLRNIREDVTENRERIVAVEASAKQAHKRLDELAGVRRLRGGEE